MSSGAQGNKKSKEGNAYTLTTIIYAVQLAFACCYLHPDIRPFIKGQPFELFFVFFAYSGRLTWPANCLQVQLNDPSTTGWCFHGFVCYLAKFLYLIAARYFEYFTNYIIFLDRVRAQEMHYYVMIQALSAYMALIFLGSPAMRRGKPSVATAVAYLAAAAGYAYLLYHMTPTAIWRNKDVDVIVRLAVLSDMCPMPLWIATQAVTAWAFDKGLMVRGIGRYDWDVISSAEFSYAYWQPKPEHIMTE